MPAPSRITPALLSEVSRRRVSGEAWKDIARDLKRRGLPHDRATWLRAGVPVMQPHGWGQSVAQRLSDCAA